MIKPFEFLRNNQCPKCKGKLVLVETENYVAELDGKGTIIDSITTVKSTLRCTKCNHTYDAEKKGMCYHIALTLPEIPVIVQDYNPFYSK